MPNHKRVLEIFLKLGALIFSLLIFVHYTGYTRGIQRDISKFFDRQDGTDTATSAEQQNPNYTNRHNVRYGNLDSEIPNTVTSLLNISGTSKINWERLSASPLQPLWNSVELERREANKDAELKLNESSTFANSEEFTILMLTHSGRLKDVPKVLEHLNGLPRLNQVILIWNGERPPQESIAWPIVNFRIQVLSNGRNSLNNRFLPLVELKTEAIFSMDDDMFPPHEMVLFAFGVWQEYRDRIVGFPGRGVSWNSGKWQYVTHPCSISMVLTGLAFIHKDYFRVYTNEMPNEIRERVDNTTNCEDIAMNFLVSHITQKPPIKLTDITTGFVCPGCDFDDQKPSLWRTPHHFEERDDCINYFSNIYGYLPLFKSEHRFEDMIQPSSFRNCKSRIVKGIVNTPSIPTTCNSCIQHPSNSTSIYLFLFFLFVLIFTIILLRLCRLSNTQQMVAFKEERS